MARYIPDKVKSYYGRTDRSTDGLTVYELMGASNPNFLSSYYQSWFVDSTENIGSPVIGHGERHYVNTDEPFFGYTCSHFDDAYKDETNDTNSVVVIYSADDCTMVGMETESGVNQTTLNHYDFSLCGKEIVLSDYNITNDGNGNCVLTKKVGTHDFPLLNGSFAGAFLDTDEYSPSRISYIIETARFVVDSDTVIREVNWQSYTSVAAALPNVRLFVNPVISPYYRHIGIAQDVIIKFIAPSKEVLLSKGRVANW